MIFAIVLDVAKQEPEVMTTKSRDCRITRKRGDTIDPECLGEIKGKKKKEAAKTKASV